MPVCQAAIKINTGTTDMIEMKKQASFIGKMAPVLIYFVLEKELLGTIPLKLLGCKLAPNLTYLVLRKELLKP